MSGELGVDTEIHLRPDGAQAPRQMCQVRDAIPALPGNSIKDRIQQIKTLLRGVRPKNGHSLIS